MPTRSGKDFKVEREVAEQKTRTRTHHASGRGRRNPRQPAVQEREQNDDVTMRKRAKRPRVTSMVEHDKDGNSAEQVLTPAGAQPEDLTTSPCWSHVNDEQVPQGGTQTAMFTKRRRIESEAESGVTKKRSGASGGLMGEYDENQMREFMKLTGHGEEDKKVAEEHKEIKALLEHTTANQSVTVQSSTSKDDLLKKSGSHRRTPNNTTVPAIMYTLDEAKKSLERFACGESCGVIPPYTLRKGYFIPYPVTESYYLGGMGRYLDESVKATDSWAGQTKRPYAFTWGAYQGQTIDDVPSFYLSSLLVSPYLEQLLKDHKDLREALEAIVPPGTDKAEWLPQVSQPPVQSSITPQASTSMVPSHGRSVQGYISQPHVQSGFTPQASTSMVPGHGLGVQGYTPKPGPYVFDWGQHSGKTVNQVPIFYMKSLLASPKLDQLCEEHYGLRDALEKFRSTISLYMHLGAPLPYQTHAFPLRPPAQHHQGQPSSFYQSAQQALPVHSQDVPQPARPTHPQYVAQHQGQQPSSFYQGAQQALPVHSRDVPQQAPPIHRRDVPQPAPPIHPRDVPQQARPVHPREVHQPARPAHPQDIPQFDGGNAQPAPAQEKPYVLTYGVHKGKTFDELPHSVLRDLERMIKDPKNTTLRYIPSLKPAFKKHFPRGFAAHAAKMPLQYQVDSYRLDFGMHKGKHIDQVPEHYVNNLEYNVDLLDRNKLLKHVLEDRNRRTGRSNWLLEQTLKRMGVDAKKEKKKYAGA